jgi:hypothetical protein
MARRPGGAAWHSSTTYVAGFLSFHSASVTARRRNANAMCHRGQATARDPNELARRCQWRAVVVGRRVPVPSVMRRGGYHLSTTACSRDDAEESTCPWLNIARAPPPSSVVPRRLCAPWNLERPCESEAHLGRPLIISLLSVVRGVVRSFVVFAGRLHSRRRLSPPGWRGISSPPLSASCYFEIRPHSDDDR